MLIWVAFTVIWGHNGIQTQATAKDNIWVHGPTSTGVYVEVCVLCCHQDPHGGQESDSQHVVLLESGDHAAARAIEIWVARAAPRGHGVIQAWAAEDHV